MADPLEWTEPGDRFHDYCLWEYAPVSPIAGKLRAASVLWQSFDAVGAPPLLAEVVRAVQAGLGRSRTVWGIKQANGQIFWELYFYDYERLDRSVSIERVLEILRPFAASALRLSPTRPYFMFSLELSAGLAQTRRLDEISVYIGNPGSTVSSGLCYQLTQTGLRYDNLYHFYNARADWQDIVGKVAASAHLDLDRLRIDDILWPELVDCGVIVVANKKYNDGVYFSRVTVDQLALFLHRLDYPATLRAFVSEHRNRLDHLLYDVGIDYRMVDGKIEILKSAYYGVV
jgi:hypothetical protein